MLLGQPGIAARLRSIIKTIETAIAGSDAEEQALQQARELDADEVGRRADAKSEADGTRSGQASEPMGRP